MIGIDMEMPKTCSECQLEIDHRRCFITGESVVMRGPFGRPDSCPLHPLDDKIRVGDEVRNNIVESRGIVTFVWQDGDVNVVIENGTVGMWVKGMVERTGRHFDEVEALLRKMRGEDDG